jgi:predicted flap endonuclease-1-like 5' DNA nuclease
MSWIADFPDLEEARDQARKAMTLPIGLSSPLWFAFGAAASAGVAWWWATRWTKAVNLEAMAGAAKAQVAAVEAFVERESEAAAEAVEAAEKILVAAAIIEPHESAPPVEIVAEPAPEAVADVEPAEAEAGDDLTRLTGIGPKLAQALTQRGITTFAQLAAWTEENAKAFDDELSLKGRVSRDAWIAQARRLAEESHLN